jgi:immunoglobulin I-set domain protein
MRALTTSLICGLSIAIGASSYSQSPSAPSVLSVAGSWDGPGSNHLGNHTISMVVAQSGSTLSGTVATRAVDPVGTTCASCHMSKVGTVSGTIIGTTLSLNMVFPSGNPADPTPHCSATITLSVADATDARIAGAYGGVDTCEGTFANATLSMTRREQIGVPAITTQPTSQTVAAGQNAAFTVAASGAPAPAYQWQVSTNGGASFTNLTDAAPYSGVTTATLTITAAAAGLTGNQYRGIATNSAGSATSSSVTLTVTTPTTVSLDRTSLQFAATSSGAAFTRQTPSQTVRILQSGTGTVTWTATSGQPWVTVSPTSGSGAATLTIGAQFHSSLPTTGTSSGSVTLSFTGAVNTAGPISVGLTTIANGGSAAPTGVIDTPADNATGVTGSIAVTGWAIDDMGVQSVKVWRDPVAGEGSALIFIGDAVLVEGARPDIANANPTNPRSTQAGWGYLMLTNVLPNEGSGTFRLTAIATDVEGKTTTLGTRTITCANNTAVRPFGAIDTPGQGEVVSGANYSNFGWVLVRGPALADPPHGGTVQAYIDGAVFGSPGAWVPRSDLTAFFPAATYPGVSHALGVTSFNTTALANGVHTIFWVVTANNAQQDGIGSRYFTVANSSLQAGVGTGRVRLQRDARDASAHASVRLDAPALVVPPRRSASMSLRDEVNAASLERRAIAGRRGFDLTAPFTSYPVAANGRAAMRAEELDRIELQLGGPGYTGYTRVGDDLGPLPIGSKLDEATGVFTWGAGVGFVHDYDLVFVRWSSGRARSRQEIRIALGPKASNRVGPQVIIDTPASAEATAGKPVSVGRSFLIAGWAIDPDDEVGTGVDTLHVWAYPTSACGPREDSESSSAGARASGGGAPRAVSNACDPIFLGATAYGGARPDVAAIFGDRFRESGYGITIDSLSAGTYDLAVFAWSTGADGFAPAKLVRVTVR